MSIATDEQTKLTATALNTVAVAFIIGGFGGPALDLGLNPMPELNGPLTVLLAVCWILIGLTLHLFGRLVLSRLAA